MDARMTVARMWRICRLGKAAAMAWAMAGPAVSREEWISRWVVGSGGLPGGRALGMDWTSCSMRSACVGLCLCAGGGKVGRGAGCQRRPRSCYEMHACALAMRCMYALNSVPVAVLLVP